MRRFLMGFVAVASTAQGASAERTGLFEILRHEVQGGGTVQLFDGGPPLSEFISGNFPDDGYVGYGIFDDTGPGVNQSSVGSGGSSDIADHSTTNGIFQISTDLFVDYLGDGPNRPGGRAEGEWTSIIEFVMPVAQAEWDFNFLQDASLGFTQTSMVLVENVTTELVLASATTPFGFIDVLTADIGDVIRVTNVYRAAGMTPANVSGYFAAGAHMSFRLVIPEPATLGLVVVAVSVCSLTRKRRGR